MLYSIVNNSFTKILYIVLIINIFGYDLEADTIFKDAFRPEGIKIVYGGLKYSESIDIKNTNGPKYEDCESGMVFKDGDTKDLILNSNSLQSLTEYCDINFKTYDELNTMNNKVELPGLGVVNGVANPMSL